MNKILLAFILVATSTSEAICLNSELSITLDLFENNQDSLKNLQNLYTGKIWTNRYRNINENQFLFTNYFLPGTVSTKGKTYKNILLKYDIYLDEILIPLNDDIIQLNKESIDSFTIKYENKIYNFINISSDSILDLKEYKGYLNVAVKGELSLYIKFKKEILPSLKNNEDFEFVQSQKIYLAKRDNIFPITSKTDIVKVLNVDINQINNFVESNKLNISIKEPESFIQVIRSYNANKPLNK
jgi:hypothetical protein